MTTNTPTPFDARAALQAQLEIEWRFASEFILDHISASLAERKPAPTSPTVHHTPDGWLADWIDEEQEEEPLAPASIGWVLWHIEWWWSDTLTLIRGGQPIAPTDFQWSGNTDRIRTLKQQWDEVLRSDDLDRRIQWRMPEPQPLGLIAAWVNFELAKNLSEINQLKMLFSSSG